MPPSPPIPPLPEGHRLDSYVIQRKISQGGFSIVYLARDEAGAALAIKEYMPQGLAARGPDGVSVTVAPEQRGLFNHGMKAFFEEGRLLARIRHANVVHVQNFFRANDTAYMVMPYEAGQSLHQVVKSHAAKGEGMKEDDLRDVFVRLLSGLREVHLQKLLHLDIKPANIFLRTDGSPLLLDFGATRLGLGESQTALAAVHTAEFAAPEQVGSGEALGPWTDIYAIGATLYTCLAGRPPQAAAERLRHDDYEPAATRFARRYSPQLLELIDWCLKLKVAERPQSVFALQKVLGGELLDLVDPSWFAGPGPNRAS